MRIVNVALVIAASLTLNACGAWQSVSDTTSKTYRAVFYTQVKTLNVDLAARASLNPDEAGRPMSVAIRAYQLRDRKSFDTADYDDLLKNDRVVLGADLLDAVGVVVNPGAAASLSQPMQADTEYVAVVAFFRVAKEDRQWRRVIPRSALSVSDPLKFDLVMSELVASSDPHRERLIPD